MKANNHMLAEYIPVASGGDRPVPRVALGNPQELDELCRLRLKSEQVVPVEK